jgi:putative sterol carrier protein
MPKYLSAEWHAKAMELAQVFPEKPGATAKMAAKVSGGPDGDIAYYQIVENGKVIDQGLGELPDADFTMLSSWDDSVKVQKGEMDANVAFMQGKMKVTGNTGKLMALMPLTMSPEYKQIQEQVREMTEY